MERGVAEAPPSGVRALSESRRRSTVADESARGKLPCEDGAARGRFARRCLTAAFCTLAACLAPAAGGQPLAPESPEALTNRELDVLRLLAEGMSNREIADTLILGEKTIKTHVSNILSKLQLTSRTQAALYAVRIGLVAEPGSA